MEHVGDVYNAKTILQQVGIEEGMRVADMGCGRSGLVTIPAAELVGESGQVYALDVVKHVLDVVKQQAEKAGFFNVISVWTDLEVYGAARQIIDGSIDIGILADTLYQSQVRKKMMQECLRMLKPGGKLLVVDWTVDGEVNLGPPQEVRVQPEEIRTLADELQLEFLDEFEAGEYHWAQVYRKPE